MELKTCALVFAVGALSAFMVSAEDVTINVATGVTKGFYEALEDSGYTKSQLTGQRIVKTGGGTLIGTNDLAKSAAGNYFRGLVIEAGTFMVCRPDDFGQAASGVGDIVYVRDGGTLFFHGSASTIALNKIIHIAGSGASDRPGAVVADGLAYCAFAQWELDADAVMANTYAADHCLLLGSDPNYNPTNIKFNGYKLTLKSTTTKGFRFWNKFRFKSSGRISVDGTYLGQNAADIVKTWDSTVTSEVLELVNGARFSPRSQAVVSLFSEIECDATSKILGGEGTGPFDMTIGGWSGPGSVTTGVSSLTITNRMTVKVSDLVNGSCLSVTGPLVFGSAAKFSLEGDPAELIADENGRVKCATSADSVIGVPECETSLGRHWSLETGTDGKSLDLVYHSLAPEGSIDVRTVWGIMPGAENADGNAALFNTALSDLQTTDPIVLFFPEGEYWFDGSLEIARDGVTVIGDSFSSVLHLAEGTAATSLIAVKDAANAKVSGLVLADTTGPAVSAVNASGLTVTTNRFSGVVGTIAGTAEKAPVRAVNCDATFVIDNYVLDGKTYSTLASLDGGSRAEGGEPNPSAVRLFVGEGETVDVLAALTQSGREVECLKGQRIVKIGPGTLKGVSGLNDKTGNYFTGLLIEEGCFDCYGDGQLGYKDYGENDPVYVRSGASLLLSGDSGYKLYNRVCHLAGTGAPGQRGAIVSVRYGQADNGQLVLDGNATVHNRCVGEDSLIFLEDSMNWAAPSQVMLNGFDLTLTSETSWGFRWSNWYGVTGKGRVIVDGTYLRQAKKPLKTHYQDVSEATLVLTNNAVFRPRSQSIVDYFAGYDVQAGSKITGMDVDGNDTIPFDMTIGSWSGTGRVQDNILSLTITNEFKVCVADLKAGRAMSAGCPLAFAAGSTLSLDDAAALESERGPFTLATSDVSISGRPRKPSGLSGWSVRVGSDGKSLVLVRAGMAIIVR